MLLCRPLKRKVDRSRFIQVTSMWAKRTGEEKGNEGGQQKQLKQKSAKSKFDNV